jgi:predicted unusual protein kinase regulating ubiquinone biosynthesis (AarF/ABC1/UbiB family)
MAYRALMSMYEYIFDLPLTWSVAYTEKHIRQEVRHFTFIWRDLVNKKLHTYLNWQFLQVDFEREARNSEIAKRYLDHDDRSLRDKVHIPLVYWDFTSCRVLTAEWIDGYKITDEEGWKRYTSREDWSRSDRCLSTGYSNSWLTMRLCFRHGFSTKEILQTTIDLFASQIFRTGNLLYDVIIALIICINEEPICIRNVIRLRSRYISRP